MYKKYFIYNIIDIFIVKSNMKINKQQLRKIIKESIIQTLQDENSNRLVTPEMINHLEPNEIFVFGSNLQGNHAGGAAKFAYLRFGAEMGNGVGLQGQSWAIPTLNFAALKGTKLNELKLPIPEIKKYVNQLLSFAKKHPDLIFYVTPIGCGIAGFSEEEIAPLFNEAVEMENVALPESFYNILNA